MKKSSGLSTVTILAWIDEKTNDSFYSSRDNSLARPEKYREKIGTITNGKSIFQEQMKL